MDNKWTKLNEKRKAEELRQSMIETERQQRKFAKGKSKQLDIYGNETVKEINHQKATIAKRYINKLKGKSNRHQAHERKYAKSIAEQLGYISKEEAWWLKVEERCKQAEEQHTQKETKGILDDIIQKITAPKRQNAPRKRQRTEQEKEAWRERVTRWKMAQEDINIQ